MALEQTDTITKIKLPSLYDVIMLNDDYTSMEFVIVMLKNIFQKSNQVAYNIMMQIHTEGSGLAGTYAKEIAETKVHVVHKKARAAGFPLRCILKKKDEN